MKSVLPNYKYSLMIILFALPSCFKCFIGVFEVHPSSLNQVSESNISSIITPLYTNEDQRYYRLIFFKDTVPRSCPRTL
jgi:hypothetical protein